MSNLIYEALKLADDTLVSMANTAVHAWNWTTGKTKTDLACHIQSAAAISEIVGVAAYAYPPTAVVAAPIYLALSHLSQQRFRDFDERERAALDLHLLDASVETQKNFYSFMGPLWFGLSGFNEFGGNHGVAGGHSLRGASYYIMRSDVLPPRKNCVSRGLDKLSEIVDSYRPQPALMPVLAR